MEEPIKSAINRIDSIEHFVEGTVLLIDKPLEWTSFDAVNRLKGFVRKNVVIPLNAQGDKQRFKVGHAGTLDPLATGLLVVCTGKFTKKIEQIQGGEKEYTGMIRFGQTTPSFDLETSPEGDYKTEHLSLDVVQEEANKMIGTQWQTPPVFSAKQVNGKRAYESARKGKSVEIPPSQIHVAEFEISGFTSNEARFRIRCSKGTYIRSLANEIGKRLGSGSHLVELRRTESHPFRVEEALTMSQLIDHLNAISGKTDDVTG